MIHRKINIEVERYFNIYSSLKWCTNNIQLSKRKITSYKFSKNKLPLSYSPFIVIGVFDSCIRFPQHLTVLSDKTAQVRSLLAHNETALLIP